MKTKLLMTLLFLMAGCEMSPQGELIDQRVEPHHVETGKVQIIEETTGNEPAPCICTKEYQPVCVDGVEYGNACEAMCAGHTQEDFESCADESL